MQGGPCHTRAMKRILAMAALVALVTGMAGAAAAQSDRSPPLSDLLRRLQRDSDYAGRIIGTHTVRPGSGGSAFLYEVRILSPDDRIVIVYLDPRTGSVVRNPQAWLRRSGDR